MSSLLIVTGTLLAIGGFLVSLIRGIIQYKTAFKTRVKQGLWCLLWGFVLLMIGLIIAPNPSPLPQEQKTPQEQVTIAEKQTKEQEASKALATYLYENFGGAGNPEYATSWYGSIKQISIRFVSNDTADVTVSTPYVAGKKDGLAENYAKTIATVIANSGKIEAKTIHVTVYGQNGVIGSWSFFKE